jgi:predicted RNase H-like nuclease/ppGpp synthetase/RelA/SpoT-type nucleotidyltranferase
VHYVGVDLAWGERKPTGVAVLDDTGRLLVLGTATTDDEVLDLVGDHVSGPCLVAFDAPLVVTNPTGNRPCEARLNQDFGRFEAGAHPSNTAKPELAHGPRGARLAGRIGLDIDPASVAPRRAIEVYPHPATVSLFRLGRTLKYKNRPGRSVDELREALLTLISHLEALVDADPTLDVTSHDGWRRLTAGVGAARTKAQLRHAEDQVDAVICAHVARYREARPGDTTTYGDVTTGYIVTPTLPSGHEPDPRRSAGSPAAAERAPGPVAAAVAAYSAGHPRLQRATEGYLTLVRGLLDEGGINYLSVTGRAKSVGSFEAKAVRSDQAGPLYPDPLHDITDQVGLRVITYLQRDVDAVARLVGEELEVLDDRDMGRETAREGRFGYASRHLLVRVPVGIDDPLIGDQVAQVQVRTVLQHAWAEFEHATRYKGVVPAEHAPDLDRRFTLAAGLLELADQEFSAIHERLQTTAAPDDLEAPPGAGIASDDLARFLTERYTEAGWSRPDHYSWMVGLLAELGIGSTHALRVVLDSVDEAELTRRMGYRYPPGAVRRLDDALLAIFGERYVDLEGNAHRDETLRGRMARLGPARDETDSSSAGDAQEPPDLSGGS